VVATEFSFFLAIPTMVAASAYSLLKYHGALSSHQLLVLAVGFIVSFAVAFTVIKFILDYVKKHDFKIFGYYRIILGIIIIAYFLIK
jgi:undecaprenyl-diphosphatase